MELCQPPGDVSNLALANFIAAKIASDGPITFAEFMNLSASHPEHGYYAGSVNRVGRRGDFLTAPETHPLFGWLLGKQVLECWQLLGQPTPLKVREYGAGRGTLAKQIIHWICAHWPKELRSVRYELSDLNPDHIDRIADHLALPSRLPVEVLADSGEPFEGIVLANEFLDALPFHRLKMTDAGVRELFVTLADGWFAEEEGEPTLPGDWLQETEPLVPGQLFEISVASAEFSGGLATVLRRGYAILVDYGDVRDELRDVNRFPDGTMKTYRQHNVGADPFSHVGEQDITAHVDFSLVCDVAEQVGLDVLGIAPFSTFLSGLGLDRLLLDIQDEGSVGDYLAARAAAMEFLDPRGLGRFKVAVLGAGVSPAAALSGLSFRL